MINVGEINVEEHLGLVYKWARRYLAVVRRLGLWGISYDDLVGEGFVGLLKAKENFDPKRGTRFSTYAIPKIRVEMQRLIKRELKAARVWPSSQIFPENEEGEIEDIIDKMAGENEEEDEAKKEAREVIKGIIKKLNLRGRQKRVLLLRGKGETLREIGKKLGVSQETVRMDLKKIEKKLRAILKGGEKNENG
jgi:RNA polymerase sigma factor (sigma-70 family)